MYFMTPVLSIAVPVVGLMLDGSIFGHTSAVESILSYLSNILSFLTKK